MRLSIDRADPGFLEAFALGIDPRWVEVSIDGQAIGLAITADDEAGMVVAYQSDSAGCLVVGMDGQPARQTLTGRVSLRLLHCWDRIWPHAGVQEPAHGCHHLPRYPSGPPPFQAAQAAGAGEPWGIAEGGGGVRSLGGGGLPTARGPI